MTDNENTGLTFKKVFMAGVAVILIAAAAFTAVSCKNPTGGPDPEDPVGPGPGPGPDPEDPEDPVGPGPGPDPDPEDTEVKFNVDRANSTSSSFKFSIPNTKTEDTFTVKIGGVDASSPADYSVANGTFTIVGKLDPNNLKDIRVQLVGSTNEGTLPGMFLYPSATKNQNTWEDLLTFVENGAIGLYYGDAAARATMNQTVLDGVNGELSAGVDTIGDEDEIYDYFNVNETVDGKTWPVAINEAAAIILSNIEDVRAGFVAGGNNVPSATVEAFEDAYDRIYMNKTLNSTNDATIKGQVKDNTSYDINTLAMQMIPEGIRDLVEDPVQYLIAEQMVRMG